MTGGQQREIGWETDEKEGGREKERVIRREKQLKGKIDERAGRRGRRGNEKLFPSGLLDQLTVISLVVIRGPGGKHGG